MANSSTNVKRNQQTPKCYNSFSCILSVLIIIFVLGAIIWDMTVTKPSIKQSINDIKIELKDINKRLDFRTIDTTKDVMQESDAIILEVLPDSVK